MNPLKKLRLSIINRPKWLQAATAVGGMDGK